MNPEIPETPIETPTTETPEVPEKPVKSQAQLDAENALFQQIDEEIVKLTQTGLKLGWIINDLWRLEFEDLMDQFEGHYKKALIFFTNVVREREQHIVESRSIISDRFHMARYISRETYAKIVAGSNGYEPSYHQLRACIFSMKDEQGFEVLDKEKFNAMVSWAVENGWPTVKDLRIHRAEVDSTIVKKATHQKHWETFYKIAQLVAVDSAPDGPNPNPERLTLAGMVMEAIAPATPKAEEATEPPAAPTQW